MTTEPNHSSKESTLVQQIAKGLRFTVALCSIAAGLYCGFAIGMVPRFQKMYGDMLSPRAVLPPATSFLLDHRWLFLVGTVLLTIVPVILAYRVRSILLVIVIGAVAVLVQLAVGVWVPTVLMAPLPQMV